MFVSCFYFFYFYFVYFHFFLFLCIYLFFSIFFFKKILVFLICYVMKIIFFLNCIFVWLDAGPPVFPKDFFNRNGTSRGPPQRLPCPALALPYLSPAPQGTSSDWKNLPGIAQFLSTQIDTTMFALIWPPCPAPALPCLSPHTYKQIDRHHCWFYI
jgi:hypothetical protein